MEFPSSAQKISTAVTVMSSHDGRIKTQQHIPTPGQQYSAGSGESSSWGEETGRQDQGKTDSTVTLEMRTNYCYIFGVPDNVVSVKGLV